VRAGHTGMGLARLSGWLAMLFIAGFFVFGFVLLWFLVLLSGAPPF